MARGDHLNLLPEDLHDEYILNQWYGIWPSAELPRGRHGEQPIGLERFGMRLVIWRDASGEAIVQHARCPHRGADLSLGRVIDGCLECPYHGFRFDGDGACVAMPCEGDDARIRKDMRTPTFVTREAHGVIWLWFGEPREEGAYPPLPWLPEMKDDDPHAAVTTFTWGVSFSRAVEGMLDMHHVPFAHRHVMPGVGARLDPYEACLEGGHTIRTTGTLRKPAQAPEDGFTMRLDLCFPATLLVGFGGDRAHTRMGGEVVLCPVDAEHTWGWVRYHQDYVTLPLLGQLVTRAALWSEMTLVQPDDEAMLLSSAPLHSGPAESCLVRADQGIALWFKLRSRERGEAHAQTARTEATL